MKHTIFLLTLFAVVTSTYVDYSMSYNAISTGRYSERNPLTRSFVMRPAIAIPIITLTGGGLAMGLDGLYKHNKTVAWIVVGLLFVAKGYIIWHNIRVLHH